MIVKQLSFIKIKCKRSLLGHGKCSGSAKKLVGKFILNEINVFLENTMTCLFVQCIRRKIWILKVFILFRNKVLLELHYRY